MPKLGPGKYATSQDAFLHDLSGDADEQIGDVSTVGWYGLVRGPLWDGSLDPTEWGLDKNEIAELKKAVGAIVHEDDQGFVEVELFFDKAKMESDWKALEKEIGEYEEGD